MTQNRFDGVGLFILSLCFGINGILNLIWGPDWKYMGFMALSALFLIASVLCRICYEVGRINKS